MTFSGNFVRTTTVNTNFQPRENWGTTADPGHSVSTWGTDQGFPSLKRPRVGTVPVGVEDQYNPTGVNADPNTIAPEREPRGHDGVGAPPRTSNRYDEIRSDTRRHEDNFGATLKNTAQMVMRSVTQTFGSPLLHSLPVATDDASATATGDARRALRGKNALAENNPGSPTTNFSGNYTRQGRQLFRFTDRRMSRRTLTHHQRPIYLNVASTAHVTKSPQGVNYSPYGSPYNSVASLNVGTARPMQRREPRPWDESAVTDGSENSYADDTSQMRSWGL